MKNLFDSLKNINDDISKLNNSVPEIRSIHKINEDFLKIKGYFENTNLIGISKLSKDVAQQFNRLNYAKPIFNESPYSLAFSTLNSTFEKSSYFNKLNSSLSDIFRYNQVLSNQIANIAKSQYVITSNFDSIAKSIDSNHLNKFNSVNIALTNLSNSFLRNSILHGQWNDINIINETNEGILDATNELANSNDQISKKDLLTLKKSIVEELIPHLTKSKSEKVSQYIRDLISIISLLLTIYSLSNSNQINYNEIFGELKKEILEEIYIKNSIFHQQRRATTNVNLRYSNNIKSKKIGLIKKGQNINVIEIKKKWLLISYIDYETGEPKSGYAYKKYFKLIK